MIFKKEVVGLKRNGEEITKLSLNVDFWKDVKLKHGSINVIIDEAHTIFNSRRAMSKQNELMAEWIALLRRIVSDSNSDGSLTLITQLGRRLDVIAKELSTNVQYHVCHYIVVCNKCGLKHRENNEALEKLKRCYNCGNIHLKKQNFIIEKWEFESLDLLEFWLNTRQKSYFKHYYITDIENYFKYYNTFQWEDLISD